jgi:hypothetical protein
MEDLYGLDEHLEHEAGAQFGDPRRCHRHPHVVVSSADGMFDGLCRLCEAEADEDAQLADNEAFEAEMAAQAEAEAFHWLDEAEGGAL